MRGKAAYLSYACLWAWGCLAVSCDGQRPLQSQAAGRPYEVLVVGDRHKLVEHILEQPIDGLPQPEPWFDVTSIGPENLDATLQTMRGLVVVDIDSTRYTDTHIRYEKNRYATPQMVIYIGTPTEAALAKDIAGRASTLRTLLHRAEMNAAIATLAKKHNMRAAQTTKEMFGMELHIPTDMASTKRGRQFVWFSNNAPTGMKNIVVYQSRHAGSTADYVALRDSVLGTNIKGETDDMHMITTPRSVTAATSRERGRTITIRRGLWEMEGDAMGGPFVSHTVGNITVEAFVFAPGTKKRNLMRQLEAALYTLN